MVVSELCSRTSALCVAVIGSGVPSELAKERDSRCDRRIDNRAGAVDNVVRDFGKTKLSFYLLLGSTGAAPQC